MEISNRFVFVTGGTGLVGSHLIYSLLVKGKRVRAIYRQGSKREILGKVFSYYTENGSDLLVNLEWVECDICDYEGIKKAISGADSVYHCAAVVSFDAHDRESILSSNIQGTRNIVNACIENSIPKVCHVSSNAALGATRRDKCVNEGHQWNENDHHSVYAISKHLAEEEVWKGIRKGLNAVIVNPTIILGPGDWSRSSSSIFRLIYKGTPFSSNGISGFVDVRDVAGALISLTESNLTGERYIVNSANLSYHKAFSLIAENLGVRKPAISVPGIFYWPVCIFIQCYEFVTGKKFYLTKEILDAAWQKTGYDGSKLIKATGISLIPVEKSIKEIAAFYLSDKP